MHTEVVGAAGWAVPVAVSEALIGEASRTTSCATATASGSAVAAAATTTATVAAVASCQVAKHTPLAFRHTATQRNYESDGTNFSGDPTLDPQPRTVSRVRQKKLGWKRFKPSFVIAEMKNLSS